MNKFIPILLLICLSVPGFAQRLETVIQKGHELAVVCTAVNSDSTIVATGSKDKTIKLWEISSGREIRTLAGHEHTVSAVDFSSDGKFLLTGSYDKTIRLWNVATGEEVNKITTTDFITDVGIDPLMRFFVSAGYNRTGYQDSATVYDFKTNKTIKKLPVNADEGRGFGVSLAISNDGEWIGFGEDNRVVNLYRTSDWRKAHTFEYEEGWCGGCSTMLTFHPDSKTVFMASHNGPVKQYDISTGTLIKVFENETKDLTGLAVSRNGTFLVRTTENNVSVWEIVTGKRVATREAIEKGAFHEVAFVGNTRVVVTSDDNTAFIWNFIADRNELSLTGFLKTRDQGGLNYDPNFYWQSAIAKYVRLKNKLLIANDGKKLIKGKFGTKVKQWDIASGKAVMEFSGHKKAVLCYDLSTDGKHLITGGGDGTIILWDVATGDSLKVIRTYREPIFDIHFNSDETKVVSSSWDATMKVHDLQSGSLTTYIQFENAAAYNILNHPNDLYLFSARLDNSLQMWELDTKSVVRNFVGHTDVVSSIQLTRDQKSLLTSGWDGSIRLWDIGTGLMTKKINTTTPVYVSIFNGDETLIYSGGADRVIKVWDVASGKIMKSFTGHQSEITSLLFSPDNKMLISHSVDGVTKFWDLQSGSEFFEHIHLGETDWMVKNPDGYFNGTDNARRFIHFVAGVKTYSVDQFFHDFYRPDLLPKIFQDRGGKNDLKGIQGKLSSSPIPTVRVAVVPAKPGMAEVFVQVTDNGGGAENVKLFHNGKHIPIGEPVDAKTRQVVYRQAVTLIGGNNQFSASARNKDRVETDLEIAEIFSEVATRSSTCHILAVGINAYRNPKMSLNYAKPDADSFSKLMDKKGVGLFKAIEVHTLYDAEATREKILAKLDALSSKIHPEDVFIFYYAGHGSMVDNKFYFIPTEASRLYDAGALHKESIEASVLQVKFGNIKALKQLIIMDACQSGGSVELLANRGASEEKAIAQLSRSAGIHVMASAGSEQFATEFSALGHGLFTYVLIQALQGAADGSPKDGKVTIYELKSYIDDQVPELTRKLKGKPQYPYTFSRGHDFPIVLE